MNVVIYARGANAQQQIEMGEKYAAAHNMTVCEITTDSETMKNRVSGGGVDAVIVYHVSRISRNMGEFINVQQTFAKHGTEIIPIS